MPVANWGGVLVRFERGIEGRDRRGMLTTTAYDGEI